MTYRVKLFRGEEMVFMAESHDQSYVVNALSAYGRSSPAQASWFLDTPARPSPVVTETVQRIKPGVHGPLRVGAEICIPDCDRPDQPPEREVEVCLAKSSLNASDWREMALEIAEYLDAQ